MEIVAKTGYVSRSFQNKKPKKNEEYIVRGNAYVLVPENIDKDLTEKLKEIFNKYPGSHKVVLAIKNGQGYKKIMTSYLVSNSEDIKNEIEGLLGEKHFKIDGDLVY